MQLEASCNDPGDVNLAWKTSYISLVAVGVTHGYGVAILHDIGGNIIVVHAGGGGVDAGKARGAAGLVAVAIVAVVRRSLRRGTGAATAISTVIACK